MTIEEGLLVSSSTHNNESIFREHKKVSVRERERERERKKKKKNSQIGKESKKTFLQDQGVCQW